ncbi:MAG: hypothetical protein K0Q59_825, partial [Paenibacillus sp.]|nr:hypothetical protein [Paenibacillus sp.]
SAVGEALDSMYPRLAQTLCHGNSNTAVPITFSPVFLAYNTDLFRTAGIPVPGPRWNVDDFTAAAEQATMTTDGRIDRFGFSLFPSLHRWLVFALQNGMRPGADDNREKIAKALTKLQDWLHRKRIATVYTDSKNLINPFIYGKAAMTLTTLFEMSTWAERGIDFTPEIAPLPFGDTQSTLLQANLLTVPSRCAEPQLSAEFVSMALDPEVQRKMCATTPFLSVMPAVNEATRSSAYLHALNVAA